MNFFLEYKLTLMIYKVGLSKKGRGRDILRILRIVRRISMENKKDETVPNDLCLKNRRAPKVTKKM